MSDDFYVYDGINKYNQILWVKEKIKTSLYSILVELKYNSGESKDNRDGLNTAFSEVFKLYAFFNKINATDYIYDFVYNHTLDGLDHLEYVLGISSKKDIFTARIESRKEILELINENNNRTELHGVIQKYKAEYSICFRNDKWFNDIDNELELISNGEKTWSWFYNKHKDDCKNDELFNIPNINIKK